MNDAGLNPRWRWFAQSGVMILHDKPDFADLPAIVGHKLEIGLELAEKDQRH